MRGRYVLAPKAALDIVQIWRYIKKQGSVAIADDVESVNWGQDPFSGRKPGAGHSRKELTDEAVKLFPVYTYLIVYRPETKPLQVVSIIHGRRDLEQTLKNRL